MLLKKTIGGAVSMLLVASAAVGVASPAQADRGVPDLRNPEDPEHRESWNTDRMMDALCGDGYTGKRGFYINVDTGEVRANGGHPVYEEISPGITFDSVRFNPGWEAVYGHCRYDIPELQTSWDGHVWKPLTRQVINCTTSHQGNEEVTATFTRSSSFTNSVSTTAQVGFADVFSASVSVTETREWSESTTTTHTEKRTLDPDPHTVAWWDAAYLTETVRINPAFEVDTYMWPDDDGIVRGGRTGEWRGRPGQDTVYSYGFYIDGTTNKLDDNGEPEIWRTRIKERDATANDCD